MNSSLQKHGLHETHKQLSTRMKLRGLDTVQVQVTRKSGKLKFDFTGSAEQVAQAHKILADWN
jgi:hypothetical protein